MPETNVRELEPTLRKAAAALRDAEIPFMLGGSLAAWVRGGPPSRNDLDFMIRAEDSERALEALEQVGMRREKPPEEWLVKAWDGDVLVDLIHSAKGLPITDEVLGRAEEMDVLAIPMLVMTLEDMLTTKLCVLDEHSLDLEPLLKITRAVREQVDWDQVRARTAGSPFARAYFTLVEELGIVPRSAAGAGGAGASRRSRVRVIGERA
ncbi:MAG TPA: nucleotidyltransferase [Thermoleophilaceae bacterium]|nr:nucleotidyltransferase [Thermoleophilaceae bacterium]